MYLYLVRHGQSEGNVLRTFHGQTDYPLTEEGRRQAQQVAEKLRDAGFTRCVASDLQRAWDTALACLEGRDILPEKAPDLREQFMGEMEGLSWEEMGERFPGFREEYIEDWSHAEPLGGESPERMLGRVSRCVDEIVKRGENTLIAAHWGSLSLILVYLGLVEEKQLDDPAWHFLQGYYTLIEIDGSGARLVEFNR